jgi:hypothetical protein
MADSLALLSEAPARAGYTLGRRSLPADRLAPRLRRVTSMIRGPAEGLPTALMRAVMLGATCAGIMGGMPACSLKWQSCTRVAGPLGQRARSLAATSIRLSCQRE